MSEDRFPLGHIPKSHEELKVEEKRQKRLFLVVVEESEDAEIALQYACLRAKASGGRVALLAIMEKPDMQQWGGIEEIMRAEKREECEQLLLQKSRIVMEMTNRYAACYLREGDKADELFKLLNEEHVFSILVLGAAAGTKGPGPITSKLASKGFLNVPVPITIVPGNLSEEDLHTLT